MSSDNIGFDGVDSALPMSILILRTQGFRSISAVWTPRSNEDTRFSCVFSFLLEAMLSDSDFCWRQCCRRHLGIRTDEDRKQVRIGTDNIASSKGEDRPTSRSPSSFFSDPEFCVHSRVLIESDNIVSIKSEDIPVVR